jgi:D-alanyl-D-alanine carboxypeptidase
VSNEAANMIGTSANLRFGQRIKIIDLLYGLMLPSGNDASLVLAEGFGSRIYTLRKNKEKKVVKTDEEVQIVHEYMEQPIKIFVKEMNKHVQRLHLKNTKFTNPHGLSDKGNRSTAHDIGILAFQCLKDPIFSKIVSTKKYDCITFIKQPALNNLI